MVHFYYFDSPEALNKDIKFWGSIMLYTVYIPKEKGDKDNNVVKMLGLYEKITEYKNSIIMSPGYLSKSEHSINKFISSFKSEILGNKSTSIGILNGMNGAHINSEKTCTVLECHHSIIQKDKELIWIPLNCNNVVDHRKVIVFYTSNDSDKNVKLLSENQIDVFLEKVHVNAVLIGSSNQSYTTYFSKKAPKGEADIFMMAGRKSNNPNSHIKEMFECVRDYALQSEFVDYNRDKLLPISDRDMDFLDGKCTISSSFAGCGNRDSGEFLKDILRNILEDGLL